MTVFFRLFFGALTELVPYAVLCGYPFKQSFRYSLRKTVVLTAALILCVSVIYSAVAAYLCSVLPHDDSLYTVLDSMLLCGFIPCFLWYLYAVRSVWQKKAFVFLFTVTGGLVIVSIYNCILNVLPEPGEYLPDSPLITSLALAVNIVAVPLLCLFLRRFYLPVERGMSPKEAGYLCIPLLLLFAIFFPVFTVTNYVYLMNNATFFMLYFGLLIMVFILYGVIFKMYKLAYERHIANEKQLRSELQIEIRDEQYKRISERLESSRKMRHDIRHHILALKGFLEAGDTARASEYVDKYLEESEKNRASAYCGNPIINMLVSHYYDAAKERDIRFSLHIDIPDVLSIHDTDLSVLLGNLLTNAVEGASSADEEQRMINLNMLCSGKMLAITVDNGFDGIVKKRGNEFISTKSDGRGLGLSILTSIAEKYDGGVEFKNDEKMFYSSVMLRL